MVVNAQQAGRRLRERARRGLLLAVIVCLTSGAVLAGMELWDSAHEEEAAAAILSAEVVPVEQILEDIRKRFVDPHVLALELEQEWRPSGRIWVYEAKILIPDGDVLEVEYDARSLEVIDLKSPTPEGRNRGSGD